MRKCKIINTGNHKLKIENYYSYELITDKLDYNGNSIFLAFPYHIYNDEEELIEVLNKIEFDNLCIDIKKIRKEKLLKLNQTR